MITSQHYHARFLKSTEKLKKEKDLISNFLKQWGFIFFVKGMYVDGDMDDFSPGRFFKQMSQFALRLNHLFLAKWIYESTLEASK